MGILDGLLGGWLSREMRYGQVEGFIAAVVFATVGSALVPLVLRAVK